MAKKIPSGKFVVRIPADLHNDLKELAKDRDQSMNGLVNSLLKDGVKKSSKKVA